MLVILILLSFFLVYLPLILKLSIAACAPATFIPSFYVDH